LGKEKDTKFKWNDKFWETSYNSGISKLKSFTIKNDSTGD